MGLVKNKPILFADDFSNSKDPFYSDNVVYNVTDLKKLPNDDQDVLVKKSQAVFFTIDNILLKLLLNDLFINLYIEKLKNLDIPADRIKKAFEQNISEDKLKSEIFETAFEEHKRIHHNKDYLGPNDEKFILLDELYNTRLKADFSNFDKDGAYDRFLKKKENDLQTLSSYQQDVVVNIEFEDQVRSPTNNVAVYVCNALTDHKFSTTISRKITTSVINLIPITTLTKYIYKEWLSGMKELMLYIPSTFTFYTEDLNESETSPTMHDRATWIKVVINKRHFFLNHIYSAEICPLSLPLLIHKDKHPYFNDCPLPSVLRTICVSKDKDNNTDCIYDDEENKMTLYFCCYGTDALAIRILAD